MSTVETFGLPTFEEIESALASDAPRRWGLRTSRALSIAVEPGEGALWILWPAGEQALSLPGVTSVIEVSKLKVGDVLHYRLGAKSPRLQREVYYFLCGIVHRAEVSEQEFLDVIRGELAAWEALLRQPVSLDRNVQIGLLGELWVLWRIAQNIGSRAIDCWTGPVSEQHDFRLETEDLEVKTTLSHSREHTISDLGQLVTSSSRPLSVVSIQLKPAGGGPGITLQEAVEHICSHFSEDAIALKKFTDKLSSIGYRSADGIYSDRYCLRSVPVQVPIDAQFPSVTRESLAAVLSVESLQRIRKVMYTVNLDGLGNPLDDLYVSDSLHGHDSKELYA